MTILQNTLSIYIILTNLKLINVINILIKTKKQILGFLCQAKVSKIKN